MATPAFLAAIRGINHMIHDMTGNKEQLFRLLKGGADAAVLIVGDRSLRLHPGNVRQVSARVRQISITHGDQHPIAGIILDLIINS